MSDFAAHISVEQIESLRQQHIGRLLLRAYRAFNERAYQKLWAAGHEGLSITHTGLLANLDLEGTHITVLAERAGMTKQAMSQLVHELEEKGYVTRLPDLADRRATLVKFTEEGWRFLRDAHQLKIEIEAEYAAMLGADRLAELREMLTLLLEHE